MEFTHQWQPSSPQPSHTNVRNGVQVSGCFPSCWNARIQFTCLNPQRNLLPPICHNNCTLPMCRIASFASSWELFTELKLPSHAISPSFHIACQNKEFTLREEVGGCSSLKGREGQPKKPSKSLSCWCMQHLELIWRAAFYIKPIYSFEPWGRHFVWGQSPG